MADDSNKMSKRAFVLMMFAAACGDNLSGDRPPVPQSSRLEVTMNEDDTVSIDATAIDPDGQPLSYTHSAPAHGTLTNSGPLFTYVPNPEYSGQETLQIFISDGAHIVTVPLVISILPINDAPIASPQSLSIQEDEVIPVTLTGSDIDSNTLTFAISTPPAHGTLSGTPPNLVYTPTLHHSGEDTFAFTASDGTMLSAPASITIHIANVIACGDGVVEGDEGCDDGNQNDTDACRNSCISATCSDGVVQSDVEQCDDGNAVDTDACRNNCMSATCGDGVIHAGVEACDDGNLIDSDACPSTCTSATCGDGFVQAGVEQCDDGNNIDSDACLSTCTAATCGDGLVQAGVEQCDDGNLVNTDACLSTCTAATCGDGVIHAGVEACDDGNLVDSDACLSTCTAATCGDGLVQAGVEQCDDGNNIDSDLCRNDCTAPVCGDGTVDQGEECDDGNLADNDACGHTCLIERCGDGFVQLPAGETCDDGNASDGDGCDSACHVEPFVTTAPVLISGPNSCTTSVANAARKIAVDGSGNLYAVMQCGVRAMVAVSTNRGTSFSAPLDLSTELGTPQDPVTVAQVAVGNGPTGVAYVGIMLTTGHVYLRVTQDAGATWSPGVLVGQASSTSAGLSLQSFNDNVYVGFSTSGGVTVARNISRGSGVFDLTPVAMSIAFFDLVYDIALGTLAVVADTPTFHVRVSNDGGVTFASEVNPPGQQYYSDWTIGNGVIFVSGTNLGSQGDSDSVYRIPSNAPTTSTRVVGLPTMTTAQARTVAADAAGNLFAGSQLDSGGIQLDRLPAGSSTYDTPRVLAASGTSPVVCGLPGNTGAVVVYTVGTSVYATVQAYP